MHQLETSVRFVCPSCKGNAEDRVTAPEPNWGASERMSDLMGEGETEVTCNLCHTTFAAYTQNGSSRCFLRLDEHRNTQVQADYAFFSSSDPNVWTNTDVPGDPYAVFTDTYHHLGDILAEYGVNGRGILSHSGPLINRMIFTQQISALEAYLGDTLVKSILDSEEALARVLESDSNMKSATVSLKEISENPNIVADSVKNYLQAILYHNLGKVAKLYKIALNINIWPNDTTRKKLFRAIVYRHDCTHRNGRNKDGDELDVFTSEYINEVLSTTRSFVDHIENALKAGCCKNNILLSA